MGRPHFDAAYERHAWPALAERAYVNGTLVALNLSSFADAATDLEHLAVQRGALYLSDPDEMLCLVVSALISEIDAADQPIAHIAHVTADIA